jgi:pyruvate/2-oxoglutarate dehydrogenase complex dihydrolipoamide dehydrogenase (E3) component
MAAGGVYRRPMAVPLSDRPPTRPLPTPRTDVDLVVIGGGAAGLTAAREGVRRGARTVLVQDGPLGGDCTFTGCVPSKALVAAAARGDDFDAAMAAVRSAVDTVAAAEDDDVLRAEGVAVRHGRARFRAPHEIDVDGAVLRASRIIVATGAGPVVPRIPGLADADPLTSETLFSLTARPERLAVLGGGAIGCEMAQAFARLGTRVTVIEADDRILGKEEPEASAVIAEALRVDGVDVRTGAALGRVSASAGTGVALHLGPGDVVEADRVLVAVGRRATTSGLGLEEVGVALDDDGSIRTDDTLATTVDGVWAIGDVNGRMPFTHAGARMGFVAARNALSRWGSLRPQRFDPAPIPWVTYTDPEVGRVGMTEAEAADHGGRVAYLALAEVDRAIATGQTLGFVKLLAGPRRVGGNIGGGRVLGATIVAPTGGDVVHEAALAMRTGMFTGRLAQTTHAYPSWASAVQQAAAQFFFPVGGRRARPAARR